MSDGAAAFVLCSYRTAKLKQQSPLAKIVSWAQTGIDPLIMVSRFAVHSLSVYFHSLKGLASVKAIQEALRKANWPIETIDILELNETYAAHALAIIRELRIDPEKYFFSFFLISSSCQSIRYCSS